MDDKMDEGKSQEDTLTWHQNDKLIFIKVHLLEDGLKMDQVKIVFDEKSIEIAIRDREYNRKIELCQPVLPKFCIYKIVGSYLEIKMKKDLHRTSKNNAWWKSLCKDGSWPGQPKKIEEKDDLKSLKEALPEEPRKESTMISPDDKICNMETPINTKTVMPKITHDWYQTETQVVIEVRAKKLKAEQVKVSFASTSLDLTIDFPEIEISEPNKYNLNLKLSNPILPEQSSYKILSTKIELKLKKDEGIRWNALEGEPSIPTADISTQKPPSYKTRVGGKDWDKIESFLENELEYLKENQDAGDVFSMIYKDADEDTRKAMNKSFQESGGTVLSTNWDEISKKKTEPQVGDD